MWRAAILRYSVAHLSGDCLARAESCGEVRVPNHGWLPEGRALSSRAGTTPRGVRRAGEMQLSPIRARGASWLLGYSAKAERYWTKAFACLCAGHVLLWTLLPTLTFPNAPIDVIEMLFWGEAWQFGYHKHPPLTAWLAEAASLLAGDQLWGVYLASQLAVVACFWAVWRMASELVAPCLAWLSVCLLQAAYYYTLTSMEFNNNVALMPFWALSIWWLYRALQTGLLRTWGLLGLCLGLGMLAKYSLGFLILPMLVFPVGHPEARRVWRTPGPYLTTIVSLLVFAPHLWWIVQHEFISLRYAADVPRDTTTGRTIC